MNIKPLKMGLLVKWMLAFTFASCCIVAHLNAAIFTVTTTADDGPGSLREAINNSNITPGPNTIDFAVTGTISPITDLPTITNTVTIDGYLGSPGGATPNTADIHAPNNAVITIEIRGPGAGFALPGPVNGLTLGAGSDGSIIRGLAIDNFASFPPDGPSGGSGILIESTNNRIEGCFVGSNTSGSVSFPCFTAISIFNDNNVIGGPTNEARNLLAGHYGSTGIVQNIGSFTVIQGNTIGLDRSGTISLMPAQRLGILTQFNQGVAILNNVIAGNSAANLFIQDSDDNLVQNNFIGTDVFGTQAVLPNGLGVLVGQSPINGPTTILIDSNLISGNTYGIHVGENYFSVFPYIGVKITNNFIGVDQSGTLPLPNLLDGIWIKFAKDTYIAGNTISANGRHGIRTGKSIGADIKNNFIGTDVSTMLSLGNQADGIRLGTTGIGLQSACDVIGGAKPGEGNFIAYNGGSGIRTFSYVEDETIIGNVIFNNGKYGIYLGPFSKENVIGIFRSVGSNRIIGDIQSQGNSNLGPLGTSNLIFTNGKDGIKLVNSDKNIIQSNIINDNNGYGIVILDSKHNEIGSPKEGSSTIPPVLSNIISNNKEYGILVISKCRHSHNEILFNIIEHNLKGSIKFEKQTCNSKT